MSETHEFVHRAGRPTAEVWEIPRRVWLVLMSWGLAVLGIAALFSFWIWHGQREDDRARDALRARQDQAMCVMLDLSQPSPERAAQLTPEQRDVLRAMAEYRATLTC